MKRYQYHLDFSETILSRYQYYCGLHQNYLKVCIHQAKVSYIQKLISEARMNPHLSGQLWAGVNSVLGRYHRKQASIDSYLTFTGIS